MVELQRASSAFREGVVVPENSPTLLTDFNLIVHPFFGGKSYKESSIKRIFDEAMVAGIVSGCIASSPAVATGVIPPYFRGSLRDEILKAESRRLAGKSDWISLYRSVRHHSPFSNNVFIMRDFLFSMSTQGLVDRVHEKGFDFSPETRVTLYGEYAEACVTQAGALMIRDGLVRQVRIAKDGSLSYGNKKGRETNFREILREVKGWQRCTPRITMEATEDSQFVYLFAK